MSLLLALIILCSILLSGCQCKHEWIDATCTMAKTCSQCGETEGEPLGHSWGEVSCAAPRTCSVCAETEGDALPHTWIEANYQAPKTCIECSATEGEPLLADFEEHGLEINLEANVETNYVASCQYSWNDGSRSYTIGQLTIKNYRTFESDETHPYQEGYEWKAFDIEIHFLDQNTIDLAASPAFTFENYYDVIHFDENYKDEYIEKDNTICIESVVNYLGQEYPVEIINIPKTVEDKTYQMHFYNNIYVHQPVGYDGITLAFFDRSTPWEDGMYIYDVVNERSLFFRID